MKKMKPMKKKKMDKMMQRETKFNGCLDESTTGFRKKRGKR